MSILASVKLYNLRSEITVFHIKLHRPATILLCEQDYVQCLSSDSTAYTCVESLLPVLDADTVYYIHIPSNVRVKFDDMSAIQLTRIVPVCLVNIVIRTFDNVFQYFKHIKCVELKENVLCWLESIYAGQFITKQVEFKSPDIYICCVDPVCLYLQHFESKYNIVFTKKDYNMARNKIFQSFNL